MKILIASAVWLVVISSAASAQVGDSLRSEPLATELRTIVSAARSADAIEATGIARSGRRMVSLETTEPLDMSRRRLAMVGGVDGDPRGTRMVVAFLRWWFQDPAAAPL